MNWYKKTQTENYPPIGIISFNSYGELGISFNGGQKYTYYGVSLEMHKKIRGLLYYKNYRKAKEILDNLARLNRENI